ncbi:MAG: pseudouridine synthase [Hyphomicrobiaceae bacterium]|nr:pseudouridine synthase [Hyphomicrobiaceae bacterium]
MTAAVSKLRLDRLLANMGYGSRKDIEALVKARRILLDGEVVTDAAAHVAVSPGLASRLTIAGKPLDPPPGFALMLHKPLGVTCSHKEAGPLVYDLLPPRWRNRKPTISTVGRLDKETSGLLLLTDDGTLLHRIIAPRSNVSKRYRVTLTRPLRGDEAARIESGTLMLDGEDEPLLPAGFQMTDEGTRDTPVVLVTLTEGRYHQVRRMFAALGNHVDALHRDRVGGLALPADLAAGNYQIMDDDDIARVFVG